MSNAKRRPPVLEKPRRGRPKTNPLDPVAQRRERQRRYRERKREGGKVAIELWIAAEHRDAILDSGQTLQEAADEAFGLLMAKRASKARQSAAAPAQRKASAAA
jgi:hypothetical protein